jgi:hypothetical protein
MTIYNLDLNYLGVYDVWTGDLGMLAFHGLGCANFCRGQP